MRNLEIAKVFAEMADLLEAQGVRFKPQAYRRAASSLTELTDDVEERAKAGTLRAIPGVGEHTAQRIKEYLEHGRISAHEALKRKFPLNIEEFTAVEGMGPKLAAKLARALKVKTLAQLKAAALAGKVRRLPGFGPASEARLLRAITVAQAHDGRFPLAVIMPEAEALAAHLRRLAGVRRVEIAGSYRRRRETVGDLDLLAVADDPSAVMAAFTSLPAVADVYAHGPTKSLVRLKSGIDADLRIVPARSWGAALHYFTGTKDHNIALRTMALSRKLKLSEYGLFRGSQQIAGATERNLYAAFDLPYLEPELRENRGELAAARRGELPRLVELGSLRGDLHVHTRFSDGVDTEAAMVQAASALGYDYLAITDHAGGPAITRGITPTNVGRYLQLVRAAARSYSGLTVLAGAEVDIRPDGSLSVPDAVLAKLDFVIASIHTALHLPREAQTRRYLRALTSPYVCALGHPTARLIGRRPGIEVDITTVARAAARAHVALEIDGSPARQDLNNGHILAAKAAGVKFIISTDAHRAAELSVRQFGLWQARRGWLEAKDVLNTWPLKRALAYWKSKKEKGKTTAKN